MMKYEKLELNNILVSDIISVANPCRRLLRWKDNTKMDLTHKLREVEIGWTCAVLYPVAFLISVALTLGTSTIITEYQNIISMKFTKQ